MEKLVRSEAQDELVRSLGSLISLVEPGEMRKHASSDAMSRDMLLSVKPDKDHFLLHYVALGDYESYSFNRNADSFPKAANQKYYDTFVKYACYFREHNNGHPDVRIGDVKAAIYNEPMGRVEVAVWGHKKKASDVYDRLKAGENVSSSMACKVAYDRDNCTGKLARNPGEYELHMKLRPGQYIEEFQKYACVHNDHPKFFDLSYVAKPADRIAHYLDYMLNSDDNQEFQKAASEYKVIPGAILAELANISSPNLYVGGFADRSLNNILSRLAKTEEEFTTALTVKEASSDFDNFVRNSGIYTFLPDDELTDAQLSSLRMLQPETLFYGLAKRAAALPFYSFVAYATNRSIEEVKADPVVKSASLKLPEVFQKMLSGILPVADDSMFQPHQHSFMAAIDPNNKDEVQEVFDIVEKKYSVEPEIAGYRTVSVVINHPKTVEKKPKVKKEEEDNDQEETEKKAAKLAAMYGTYKVTSVHNMEKLANIKLDSTSLIRVVSQNHIL